MNKYYVGSDIDVYVNPAEYSEVVVDKDNDFVPQICFCVGTVLILFSLYTIYS